VKIANPIDREKSRRELVQDLNGRAREFTALRSIAQTAIESLNPEEILNSFVDGVAELLGTDMVIASFANDEEMLTANCGEVSPQFLRCIRGGSCRPDLTDNEAGLTGLPLVIEDTIKYRQLVDIHVVQEGLRSVIVVPLKSSGNIVGMLLAGNHTFHSFTSADIQLLSAMTESLGPILKAAALYRALQEKSRQLEAQNEQLMRQQRELKRRTREAEEANQLKSEFLDRISHELRTPLNSVIGFSELLLDEIPGTVNDDQRQCLSDILAGGKHLLYLVDQVLDISKIESGRMELKLKPVALAGVVKLASKTMAPVLKRRRQHLELDIENGIPPVYADKNKLNQVLLNLLQNAADFSTDDAEIRIEVARKGNTCEVSVIDHGAGMSDEEQKRIFEPFYHTDDPSMKPSERTGLGLTIVRQILDRHGGRIRVESTRGKGSTFRFALPISNTA